MNGPEFYVGYQPAAPPRQGRFTRRAATALLAAALLTAIAWTLAQGAFPEANFEFGIVREWQGTVGTWPAPMLATPDRRYLLVGAGKHGFAAAGLAGQRVRVRGSRIWRGADEMIEVAEITPLGPGATPSERLALGRFRLTGEIVDLKCYLGVMNPGAGKVHRGCAARCLSGGVPAGFLVRDADGAVRLLLLEVPDRARLLQHVAEPAVIEGALTRAAGKLILTAEYVGRP